MKYLFTLCCILLLVSSCKKKYCWECEVVNKYTLLRTNAETFIADKKGPCDLTETEIDNYIEEQTKPYFQPHQSGDTFRVEPTMTCKKKP